MDSSLSGLQQNCGFTHQHRNGRDKKLSGDPAGDMIDWFRIVDRRITGSIWGRHCVADEPRRRTRPNTREDHS
ncbi:hypothetical protein PC119_g11812 [Phytophthora cactorum]|nr:hypothetical protein PC119_g11812 [Phytophthora cactorum]